MTDAQTGKTDWEQPAVTALGGRWVVSSFFFLVALCFLISPEGACVALIITTKDNKRCFSKIQITGYMLPGNMLRRTANLQLMVTKVQNVTADWVLVSSVPVWTPGLIFVPACLLPCAVMLTTQTCFHTILPDALTSFFTDAQQVALLISWVWPDQQGELRVLGSWKKSCDHDVGAPVLTSFRF